MNATPATSGQSSRACPECGATIVVVPGYITWCDNCNWNILPDDPGNRPNLLEDLYIRLTERLGKGLLDDVLRGPELTPRLTVSVILGIFIALLVHALTLAIAVAGVYVIVRSWPYALPMAAGGLLLLTAWVLRPRLGRVPAEAGTRKDYPVLARLVDTIADALGVRRVDGIVLTGSVNASVADLGWRRRRILFAGVPLLAALDGQERVAVLAHELAHAASGDTTTHVVVSSALASLNRWYGWLRPIGAPSVTRGMGGITGILLVALNLVALAISSLVWAIGFVLAELFWRSVQRAEYRADAVSATVSGTRAAVSALDKCPVLPGALDRATRLVGHKREYERLFDEYRRYAAAVPERECERLRRVEAEYSASLDPHHPPRQYRMEHLRAHAVLHARVVWPSGEDDQLSRELAPLEHKVAEALVAEYRSRVYYWEA